MAGWQDFFVGQDGQGGAFSPIMSGLSGLANAWTGMQALDLGKDQFGFTKDSFNTNLLNQQQSYNTQLEAQKRARMAGAGNFDLNTPEGAAAMEQALGSYVVQNKLDQPTV